MDSYRVVTQFGRTLRNLDAVLDKAKKYAEARKFDVNNFCTARLFPDMLPFVSQIRIACDKAKFAAANLSGKAAPKHEDTETTMAELRARIAKCLAFLDTLHRRRLRAHQARHADPAAEPARQGDPRRGVPVRAASSRTSTST